MFNNLQNRIDEILIGSISNRRRSDVSFLTGRDSRNPKGFAVIFGRLSGRVSWHVLVHNPPNHQTEDAEYREHSNSDELEDEVKIDIEYLRDRPVHDMETYLLNFLTEWGIRDVSFKKMDKLLAGLRVIFPGLPKSYKTILRTPRTVNIKEIGQGLMWYKNVPARQFVKGIYNHNSAFSILLTTTLSSLKKLHGPVVSNLDRDLLRDVSSKLDIVLMNQRRIINKIFPGEAIVERPENCPPPSIARWKSFEAFNEFLKIKIAFSQFVSYLNGHILDDSDQWNAATCLMSIILHNELARQVSWKGTRGVKISFYGTRIKEALFCAIMSRFKDQSLKNAEESMKRWLNTSGQRK
ncbi:uncharacterized protein [Temnothorax nylanderi]|uniref:uncharacterized protein n=1 Tax=Temnothorax nylanderi TaxID=102681 RepID=UPI003A896AF4